MNEKLVDSIILREHKYDFEFIGATLVMLFYDKNGEFLEEVILEENK